MSLCFPSTIFLMLLLTLKSAYGNDEQYDKCKQTFQCGNVTLSYPFYDDESRPPYCGFPGFQITCRNGGMPEISMSGDTYYILSADPLSPTIFVAMQKYWLDLCPSMLSNTTITSGLFKYTPIDENITVVYNCPTVSTSAGNQIFCNKSSYYSYVGYIMTHDLNSSAKSIKNICPNSELVLVPVVRSYYASITDTDTLLKAFQKGFQLEWIAQNELCDGCRKSGGVCGSDMNQTKSICYCTDQPYDSKCSTVDNRFNHHKVLRTLAIVLACSGLVILLVVLACYMKRRYYVDNPGMDALMKKYGPFSLERYSYRSLEKMTNSFKVILGKGGYGIVYQGKLGNDQLVAVKLLDESREYADDFINEVRSIGRTNHVNIVMLLGFCYEGTKRALVYDYMPNGSLDKFIHGGNNYQSLAWDRLFQIAVGIARGLDYLHRGCNTRIVHFDIKPHNILLDENLCPKIADFGLAKLCQNNVSMVSVSQARGTVGFIAPEVRCQSFGVVSYKSDVYSYGMLVLDMVGCRKNVNAEVRQSSEYFPDWIYSQLEETEDVTHQDIFDAEANGTQRKMIVVGLNCIQTDPSQRPAMTKVVEMLEGPLESLQIPTKQSLSYCLTSQLSSPTEVTLSG